MSGLRLPPIETGREASRLLAQFAQADALAIATPSAVAWLTALPHPFARIETVAHASQEDALRLQSVVAAAPCAVVAVGGGKALDVAKLAARAVPGDDGSWEPAPSSRPFLAVPTICGSGSEASAIAVISSAGHKKPWRFEPLRPDAILHFPERLAELPARLRTAGLFDALTHLVEGSMSPLAESVHQAVATTALPRFLHLLELAVFTDRDLSEALWLSALAGSVQDATSVGLVHGLSHVLEARTSAGHAELNAALLGTVLRFDREKSPKWDLLCQSAGLDPETSIARIEAVAAHWSYTVPQVEADDEFCQAVARDVCTRTNCRLVRPADVATILGKIH